VSSTEPVSKTKASQEAVAGDKSVAKHASDDIVATERRGGPVINPSSHGVVAGNKGVAKHTSVMSVTAAKKANQGVVAEQAKVCFQV
jgi:hypothetical protein